MASLLRNVLDLVVLIVYSIYRAFICGLTKLVPNKVKQLYFQHIKHRAQYLQGLPHSIIQKVGLSKGIRVYKMVIGNNMNCHKDFLRSLDISLQEVISMGQSDVIIAFVPIVSRTKTDIQAALKYIPENWPVVLVVLHHTFDPGCIVPESRRAFSRSNTLAVDCLFHEEQGLLKSRHNTKALEATAKYLQDIKMN